MTSPLFQQFLPKKLIEDCEVVISLSLFDLNQTYKRTIIGPWWSTIQISIWCAAMTLVYGQLIGVRETDHIKWITCGMMGWQWVAGVINVGGGVFVSNKNKLENHCINNDLLSWAMGLRFVIIFLHQSVLVFLLFLFGILEISLTTFLVLPSILICFFVSIPVINVIGITFARIRDIQRFVSSIMVIFMMVTPVFWFPDMIQGTRRLIVDYNPFYHIIEIIRQPLLGNIPTYENYAFVFGVFGFFLILQRLIYTPNKSKIIFWI